MTGDRAIWVMVVCLLTLTTAALRQTAVALALLLLAILLTVIWAPIPPAIRGYFRRGRGETGHGDRPDGSAS